MGYENVLKYGCLDYRQHLLRALTSGSSKIYLLVLLVLLSSGVVKLIEMLLKKISSLLTENTLFITKASFV